METLTNTAKENGNGISSIIQNTAENSKTIIEQFLQTANEEQLKALVNAYLSNETLKIFSEAVRIAGIDTEKEKARFLENYESPATKDAYRRAIERLEKYASELDNGKGKSIAALSCKEADDFINSLKKDDCGAYSKTGERATASIRRDIAAVSSFYTFLERRHENLRNPFRGTRERPQKKAAKVGKYPTKAEVDIILKELPPKLKAAVFIMANRGLRIGALPNLKIKDNVFITESKGKEIKGIFDESILKEIQKAGLSKSRPFEYLKEPLENGKARKTSPEQCLKMQIQNYCTRLYKAGKIQAVYSAHDFRHFYAVHEYEKDKDIYRVSKLLNHSSIQITETYLKGLNVIL